MDLNIKNMVVGKNINNIPIFINSYNRYGCLKKQITRFEEMELLNLIIIDNASTYPPLLEYLNELSKKYTVVYLSTNLGSYALWRSGMFNSEINLSYYIYTDPDIVPIPECPSDVVKYLIEILEKYSRVCKVGIGLRIDNLPDTKVGNEAREFEEKYWNSPLGNNLYKAPIDTTFCVYRPNGRIGHQVGIRTGYPYVAEHSTWYEDLDNLSEELKYYKKTLNRRWTQWFR